MGCENLLGITDPSSGPTGDDAQRPDVPLGKLTSITIEPDPLTLPLGITKQITVIGHFDSGGTDDLTAMATFTLDSGTAATITSAGVAHAVAQGPVTFSATAGGFSDSIDATVGPPAADHLLLSIGNFSLDQQQRAQLHATVVFTDGSTQDGTSSVTWSTDDPTVATVVGGTVDAQTQSGAATITASTTDTPPVSVIATVSVLACHPVINETQSGSTASASDEWCEILNPCTVAIDVTDWSLVYRAASATGATDTNLLITLVGSMAPGEIRLFAGNGFIGTIDDSWGGGVMQQNNGAMGLRSGPKDTGPLVDAVAYGIVSAGHPFQEGTAAAGLVNGKSLARTPFDGNDTNDGATNFVLTTLPTPRALNTP
jgi:hypothetical protein